MANKLLTAKQTVLYKEREQQFFNAIKICSHAVLLYRTNKNDFQKQSLKKAMEYVVDTCTNLISTPSTPEKIVLATEEAQIKMKNQINKLEDKGYTKGLYASIQNIFICYLTETETELE